MNLVKYNAKAKTCMIMQYKIITIKIALFECKF